MNKLGAFIFFGLGITLANYSESQLIDVMIRDLVIAGGAILVCAVNESVVLKNWLDRKIMGGK